MLLGLDASYKYGDGGELIEIHGGVEAFFDFDDPLAWHLYLGKDEPREQRIRARVFKLFEANAYFMLDARSLATGAWVGYDARYRFGPLLVAFSAWMEGDAKISYKPPHYSTSMRLHGGIELRVFGFGLGLHADAAIAAEVFDPFHLKAEVEVGIELPWPLPDFSAHVTLEWGPEKDPPPLPLPLKEVAVGHPKTTMTWPLPRGSLLLPEVDPDRDGFLGPGAPPAPPLPAPPPNGVPVVPLDARPQISFGRSLHDDALAGSNAQPVLPEFERIGDPQSNQGPARVRYGLKEVTLSRFVPGGWQLLARSGVTPNQPGIPRLFGSWAPVPQLPSSGPDQVAQSKLTLWSRSAFDWSRHTGGRWDEWFSNHVERYPCPPPLPRPVRRCCDFEGYETGQRLHPPFSCGSGITIDWQEEIEPAVSGALTATTGHSRGLLFPGLDPVVSITLPEPARSVRVIAVDGEGIVATARLRDGSVLGPIQGGTTGDPKLEFEGDGIVEVVLRPYLRMNLVEICFETGPSLTSALEVEKVRQHLIDETARWSQTGEVLQPWTQYRLAVITTVEAQGEAELAGWSRKETVTELAHFRTEGPPGLGAPPSLPPGSPAGANFDSGLTTLARYVRQTVPATVPPPGSPPPLPRPVYRGYDVGVEFNVDYADLMYRLSQRDLVLYLFDANGLPARNAEGAILAGANRWGGPSSCSSRPPTRPG